ncbi:hypothetical protein DJ021_14225 [Phenylobacterium hankyongense]|uniref:GNAT family N-acetyltransferase n=1 Tax=Phenylobacterium hankyongense TaxID=1813876 RepID=A0A328B4P2_9CAUL|nr:hypothetical protein [Phenylobacterium hankyongense]RAK60886.1 hypothetical protein DJ021_14225 [Phenylobacterium hankyongense]
MSFEADWARCAPWIDAALAHAGRTHGLSDVKAMILAGDAGFWPGRGAALVATTEDDPGERRLLIWLAGGELSELRTELLPQAEAWARACGCRRVLIIGRPGWERALKRHGFAPLARLIAKEL